MSRYPSGAHRGIPYVAPKGGWGVEKGEGQVLTFGYLVFVWMLFHLPITSIHLTILAWMSEGFIIIVCKPFMLFVFFLKRFSSIIVLESVSIIVLSLYK